MDGNGRWAQQQGLSPRRGHEAGAKAVRTTIQQCLQHKISALTVFVFSTENWKRSRFEVSALLRLMEQILVTELTSLKDQGIEVNFMGNRTMLPQSLVKLMERVESETALARPSLFLNVALNYGAREEIAEAAIATESSRAKTTEDKKHEIGAKLGLGKLPADLRDPDLLIRTGGEMRLSNFLLWNLAYTELYFTPVMWPDFDEGCFEAALDAYCLRERRFGARLGVPRKRKQKHLQVSG